jgi:hypothetical protein
VKIIAVDWGKDRRKRSAYLSELPGRTISRLAFDGSLENLLDYASAAEGPVLIGIDAAIGFPAADWTILARGAASRASNFMDFLLGDTLPADFFSPVAQPSDWSPQRPFIRPPAGRWSLKAFENASDGGFYRLVDRRLKAQPIFVTSGIPGSVGSGTSALWQEMTTAAKHHRFRVWPFHGSMQKLLRKKSPLLAEIYPKACYGIALSEMLPANLLSIAKTRQAARQHALDLLRDATWINRERIILRNIDAALANEDDFDALMSAAALTRLVIEKAPLDDAGQTESGIEGGVLGAASLDGGRCSLRYPGSDRKPGIRTGKELSGKERSYRCPVPGCTHLFRKGRSGWDAHIASLSRHPHWHPEIRDATLRKEVFRKEFKEWFSDARKR